jgi:D-alanyl-D-alanine carboxypeptidase (penicillin-binding protein 5/6)
MSRFFRNGWLLFVVFTMVFITFPGQRDAWAGKVVPKAKSSQNMKASKGPAESQGVGTIPAVQGGLRYDAQSAVLEDALSGQVLYEQNSQKRIAPASFVKILTLYIALDAIRSGQLKMDDWVTVSEKAWRIDGSKMFIKVGDRVKVEDLLKGIAIASGNDACIALAEHMAGSEEVFVSKMNEKASLLGLKDSKFTNSHGMPDAGQYTTAMDMVLLAKRYVEDHPEALRFHSTTEFEYNGIRQGNRNTLLGKDLGVDGLKTGHVEESGYHLLATAKRDGQRMIAVVMGCDSMKKRASEARKLLEYGFKNFSTVEAIKKGEAFGPLKVKRGKEGEVSLAATESAWVTVEKGKESSVAVSPQLPTFAMAPIQKNQALAKAVVQNNGTVMKEVALVASVDVQKSLLPPWPVLVGGFIGLMFIGLVAFRWRRRPKQKRF